MDAIQGFQRPQVEKRAPEAHFHPLTNTHYFAKIVQV